MSHGVQLHDIFLVLPVEQAQQEFQREIAVIHDFCIELLQSSRIAA
jgi:hypothetical protein